MSGPLAAREALAEIFVALEPMSLDVEELGTIELVMAETLNNIVEHAYPAGSHPGRIEIFGESKADGLHFRVEDNGLTMPDGHAPIGIAADLDVDLMDLPEGGFGWFLIRDLAKDVAYERLGEKNVLNLRVAITRNEP
ncbi:MAG: ATP-binding protein [Aliishimia sp.]